MLSYVSPRRSFGLSIVRTLRHEFGIFMDFSSLDYSHDIRTDLAGTDLVAAEETVNGDDFLVGDLVSCAYDYLSMHL